MTDIRRVGDSGIHTVEGNLAGSRAAGLTKKRQKEQEEYEEVKNKIKLQNSVAIGRIDDKFNTSSDILEQEFKKRTVGLVSAEDFRKARSYVDEEAKAERDQMTKNNELILEEKKKKREEKQKKLLSTLSFHLDDENVDGNNDNMIVLPIKKKISANAHKLNHDITMDTTTTVITEITDSNTNYNNNNNKDIPLSSSSSSSSTSHNNDNDNDDTDNNYHNNTNNNNNNISIKIKKLTKNPMVDTSFLPDRDREIALAEAKERLKEEWIQQQEIIKNELLEVVYSYWDGSGHRKSIQVKKGTSIGLFLEQVKQQLLPEFHELRAISAENLIYVKEDLIIPHTYTFYDLIITKARGKSGPLFHFDVHDDVRLLHDIRIEKDESHPGKIVDRRWYDKNKHIFPASRWEVYNPAVTYEKYTIHGQEVHNNKDKK